VGGKRVEGRDEKEEIPFSISFPFFALSFDFLPRLPSGLMARPKSRCRNCPDLTIRNAWNNRAHSEPIRWSALRVQTQWT